LSQGKTARKNIPLGRLMRKDGGDITCLRRLASIDDKSGTWARQAMAVIFPNGKVGAQRSRILGRAIAARNDSHPFLRIGYERYSPATHSD
jgi:hypothetical protein